MNQKYFKLRLKQNFKYFPTILLVTLLTVVGIVVACSVLLTANASGENKQKISIGIVGNMEDTYFDIGLNVLKDTDASSFYFDWLEFGTEEEAIKALENRKITGYVRIPEDYIEHIFYGENNPARYVMLNAPEGFGTIISSEIATIISDVVVESQVGMYSMQDVAREHHPKGMGKNISDLMNRYLNFILERHEISEVENLGIADSLSFGGYYVCSLLLIFMLFWGISCNKIFASNSIEYAKILNNAGLTPRQQAWADYKAYFLPSFITLLAFGIVFGILLQFVDVGIPELSGILITDCIGYLIMILPVIMMIFMMQSAIYELIPNRIAAILMQFILTIVLGYVSGCFYPTYFFPERLQNIAAVLPVGAGFTYMKKSMAGLLSFQDFALVLGYTFAFFLLTLYAKKYKIKGDAR